MNTPRHTFRLTSVDTAHIQTLQTAWKGPASNPTATDVVRESLRRAVESLEEKESEKTAKKGSPAS